MSKQKLLEKIKSMKIIPVVTLRIEAEARRLCELLIANGFRGVEITFREEGAEKIIELIKKEYPDMVLGAGTVLNIENLKKAILAGADFAVSPGLNPKVVKEANKEDFSFFPGVATPTEIEQGLEIGIDIFKFFPAEASGGIKLLKTIYAPYRHLGVQFIPTGGIDKDNMNNYLKLPEVLAVAGSWLAPRKLIQEKKWDEIESVLKNTAVFLK